MAIKIVYRTCEYDTNLITQTFDYIRPEYKLDSSKDILVKVGDINVYELIQSNADCALDKILDKFLMRDNIDNHVIQLVDDKPYECANINVDLSDLGSAYEKMDALRDKYNIPANYSSFGDIVNYLQSIKNEVDKRAIQLEQEKSQKENFYKKGIKVNENEEKKTLEEIK
jgi:hypothetical protein